MEIMSNVACLKHWQLYRDLKDKFHHQDISWTRLSCVYRPRHLLIYREDQCVSIICSFSISRKSFHVPCCCQLRVMKSLTSFWSTTFCANGLYVLKSVPAQGLDISKNRSCLQFCTSHCHCKELPALAAQEHQNKATLTKLFTDFNGRNYHITI